MPTLLQVNISNCRLVYEIKGLGKSNCGPALDDLGVIRQLINIQTFI